MFTDLVGYSALSQKNEALALELLEEHRQLLRPLFVQHNGTEIKTIGDAFLVEFASAVEAARCAIAIQKALTAHTSVVAPERRIQVRIGLHVGDVVVEKDDVLGDGVNIASRIEPLAAPGGICVTGTVADQVKNKIGLPLESLGEQRLKNIKEPVTVYRVVLPWEKGQAPSKLVQRKTGNVRWLGPAAVVLLIVVVSWWLSSHRTLVIEPGQIRSIAVLPLDNLMNDPDKDYFVDGMHEALISELGKISALRVISRTSVVQYKQAPKPLPEIARELGVDAVVEGSVLWVGEKVKITIQLIGTAPERHLWTDNYTRDLRDVLVLHSELARAIANEIKVTLTPEEERLTEARRVDPRVHDAYLRGRFHINKNTLAGFQTALEYFMEAINEDPAYAPAYAGLATVYLGFGWYGGLTPGEAFPMAKAAAGRALELDSTLAEGHASLGYISTFYDWDWDAGQRHLSRALRSAPNSPMIHLYYMWYLISQGRVDESLAVVNRAYELDPLSPMVAQNVGFQLWWAGRYDDALERHQKTLRIDSRSPATNYFIGLVYLQKEMYSEGIAAFRSAIDQSGGNPEYTAWLGYANALVGNRGKAEGLLADLETLSTKQYISSYDLARIHIGLGEMDQAFARFQRAYDERAPWMAYLKVDPTLDPARSDSRFKDLLRRMNLE